MTDTRTTIILVRHGECSANLEKRFRGRHDFELNDLGHQQAEQLADALEKLAPCALCSSPLLRAQQTLAPTAARLGLAVQIEEGLNNISLGRWEGQRKEDVAREEPDLWRLWSTEPESLSFPGMESLEEVARRSSAAVDRLVARHAGETIALCTHRTVLKPLLPRCLGMTPPCFWKFHVDTASISILMHEPARGYSLFSLNRIDHLTELHREWD